MASTRVSRDFEGVILRSRSGAGSDSYVDIFSLEFGLVGALAKGGRASKKRFAGGLDVGTFGRFQAEDTGKIVWRLDGMTVLFQPLSLRTDLERLAGLSLMCEAVQLSAAAGEPDPAFYQELRESIVMLDSGAIGPSAKIWKRILVFAGLMGDASSCEACGAYPPDQALFAPPRLICARCAPPTAPRLPQLLNATMQDIDALSDSELKREVLELERFFAKWFEKASGTTLKSVQLLSQLLQ